MKIQIKKNTNLNKYKNWSIWKCPISKFDWEYNQEEHCYIIEGDVIVSTKNETVNITSGDYIIFPEGLKCHWNVTKAIKKHYKFK